MTAKMSAIAGRIQAGRRRRRSRSLKERYRIVEIIR
jgi:hypothetical protein